MQAGPAEGTLVDEGHARSPRCIWVFLVYSTLSLVPAQSSDILLQAPGEAEAELAQLNKLGIVDAILTDDSDALVFGAKTVITM
jgi:hypothetical protein